MATRRSPSGRVPHPALRTFPAALAWMATRPSLTIVQIGANAGDTPEDPLYRFLRAELDNAPADRLARTRILFVEPVAAMFDRLRHAYTWLPSARFEQAAIADAPGTRPFYRLAVDPDAHGMPSWLSGLGSLRSDRMTTLWNNYELAHAHLDGLELQQFYTQHRVVDQVACLTFDQLLARHELTDVDLLQIDAEGSDYDILRTIDFDRVRPAFINYERVLLQADEPACRALLTRAGYALTDWGQDTLCTRLR